MIYTARYQYKFIHNESHHPVRTSRGAPRFKIGYELRGAISELMPPYEIRGLDHADFRAAYLAHLDSVGFKKVSKLLHAEKVKADGKPVLLMCFCGPDHEFCHRHMFAEWYEFETGIAIPELVP